MVMGSDFDVYALLKNNNMESKTCNVKIFAKAVQYNGKRGKPCGYASGKLEVPPGEGLIPEKALCVVLYLIKLSLQRRSYHYTMCLG